PALRALCARPLSPAVPDHLRGGRELAAHDRSADSRGIRPRRDRDGLRIDRGLRSRAEPGDRRRGPRPGGERVLRDRRRGHRVPALAALGADRWRLVTRALFLLSLGLLGVRILSAAFVVIQPGFTDAYYYVDVARRLANGQGLTADFIWNFLEAPTL